MATKLYFDGKVETVPDIYTRMVSGIVNPPINQPYGKMMIIDTGLMASAGSGCGVLGTQKSGKAAVVRGVIDTPQSLRDFAKRGIWWDLAEPLFRPFKSAQGVSSIDVVRAAETTPATASFVFTGGGANGGSIQYQTVDEGLTANGVLESSNLIKGFGAIMKATQDAAKFVIEFYLGTYKGVNHLGNPLDGIFAADAMPKLIVKSASFSNIEELHAWSVKDKQFSKVFTVSAYTKTGSGLVDAADLTANASVKLFSGATESYSSEALDAALEAIQDLPYNFVLLDKFGADAAGTENLKIQYHFETEAKHGHIGVVAAYGDSTGFEDSKAVAASFDSEKFVVVHGDPLKTDAKTAKSINQYPVLYKAARVLGRIAGLPPQNPPTFKLIGTDGEAHELKKKEKESGLDAGLLMTAYDDEFGGISIVEGINSLQDNEYIVNGDSQSHLIQIVRIKHQLNYDLYVNAKQQLFGGDQANNRNTLSVTDVKTWTESFLKTKVAKKGEDNLIIKYQNVVVERVGDAHKISYEFEPNGEINKMLFTGIIID